MKIVNLAFYFLLLVIVFKGFNIASAYYFDIKHAIAATETTNTNKATNQAKNKTEASTIKPNEMIIQTCTKAELKIFDDLKERHNHLLDWENELRDREILVNTTKILIDNKIKNLEDITQTLEALVLEYKREATKNIKSLVKIYENMNPREAAQILDRMETTKLLEIMKYMKESKASQIIAFMRPEKARDLTGTILVMHTEIINKNYFE